MKIKDPSIYLFIPAGEQRQATGDRAGGMPDQGFEPESAPCPRLGLQRVSITSFIDYKIC